MIRAAGARRAAGPRRPSGFGAALSVLVALAVSAGPAWSQGASSAGAAGAATLADIRQEIAVLSVEMDRLRRELSTTGAPQVSLPASALERIDAIEAELRGLTAQTEAIAGRLERVAADGTRRVADLEFRLTELAGGDLAALPPTPPLGEGPGAADVAGAAGAAVITPPEASPGAFPDASTGASPGAFPEAVPGAVAGAVPRVAESPQLAVGERADYDRAVAAFEAEDHAEAARLLGAFADAYPGSPLAGDALYRQGLSLEAQGDVRGAARAYLAGFSGAPNGDRAAETLLALAEALRDLGQMQEACVAFGEVRVRFEGTRPAGDAARLAGALGCP